jgi:phenylpropionate dioxygenase-like ring-hydroxylating dioxygenase large terminal subunit
VSTIGEPMSVVDEWFPVAGVDEVPAGGMYPFRLLGSRYLLLAASDGDVIAVADSCPHRGAQLSLGSFDGERLQCPYHGWRFSSDGECVERPAHPGQAVPDGCSLKRLRLTEAYGMWWMCLGESPRNIPSFPLWDERVVDIPPIGPKLLHTSGPRVIENFLDIAHFPYVHTDYLGQSSHAEVRDYDVVHVDGGVEARNVVFWQPNPGPRSTNGGDVLYGYRVDHPYAASLWKRPSEADGGAEAGFALLLMASPVTETECRVWMLTSSQDRTIDPDGFNAFNGVIFDQDVAVVESQEPKRLPLDPRAEVHQRADRMSMAYRRWLNERGVAYGTIPGRS